MIRFRMACNGCILVSNLSIWFGGEAEVERKGAADAVAIGRNLDLEERQLGCCALQCKMGNVSLVRVYPLCTASLAVSLLPAYLEKLPLQLLSPLPLFNNEP